MDSSGWQWITRGSPRLSLPDAASGFPRPRSRGHAPGALAVRVAWRFVNGNRLKPRQHCRHRRKVRFDRFDGLLKWGCRNR